jgi:hypothetical protein
MNQITGRTMFQRGSMAGAVLALDGSGRCLLAPGRSFRPAQLRPVSGVRRTNGPVLGHQYPAGAERARRRQHLVGRPAQLLLLARSAEDVTGAFFTQILPFYDARTVALYGEFERGLYAGLA